MPKVLGMNASKGTIIGVSIGGATLAGYLIYRQVQKNKQAAASTQASQAAAASAYGYAMAASGYGYGSGYYGYGEGNYYGYGASGGFYPQGYYGYGTTQPPGGPPNTTDAQWSQAAINQLTGEGYDAQTVSAALGAYVLGQPVTSDQRTIIMSAIGIEGYPPVPGANGYPPAIQVQGQHKPPGGGTVKVPDVTGKSAETARQDLRVAGLKYNISASAQGVVTRQNPVAGRSVKSGTTVNLTLKGR